ncbi:histidine kinase [Novosphingobium panipatense]
MLGYFGAYRESSRQRLTRLARWPLEPALGSRRTWLKELCLHAGSVIGSKHIIVVWHEHETDQAFLASWQTPDLDLRELSAALSSAEIDAAISGAYDCATARVLRDGEVQAVAHALTRLGLPEVLSSSFVVSAGFSGLRLGGAVLLLEPNCRWEEAVALSEIIATRIGAELERLDLIARHSDDVRAAERNRLAQDLHDSVLQDLTATSLRLHALGAVTPPMPKGCGKLRSLCSSSNAASGGSSKTIAIPPSIHGWRWPKNCALMPTSFHECGRWRCASTGAVVPCCFRAASSTTLCSFSRKRRPTRSVTALPPAST